jgi:indolepyruvate ferredoxin oxidoreductase, beta subunit
LEHNILITSVGGQGGITLARVLAYAAMRQSINVVVGETLGMAQRGGSVESHVRIGEEAHSQLIPRGGCNVLLSLEPSESVRASKYLSPETQVILSTTPVYPIPVMLKEASYPELQKITSALNRIGCKTYAIDAAALAIDAEAPTSLNVVILGAYAALDTAVLNPDSLKWALGEALSKKSLDANIRAFDKGYEAMKKLM